MGSLGTKEFLSGTNSFHIEISFFFFSLAVFAAYKNCAEIYKSGERIKDGVYTIKPDNLPAFDLSLRPNNCRWEVDSVSEEAGRLG